MNLTLRGKKSATFIFNVSLVDQSNTKLFKVNPTLATGDVKVSIDGAAFANIATLPTVTPSGGANVKVTLSSTEMAGSTVKVLFSDAAGAEWCDLAIDVHTEYDTLDLFRLALRADFGITSDLQPVVDAINANLGSGAGSWSSATPDSIGYILSTIGLWFNPISSNYWNRLTTINNNAALLSGTNAELTAVPPAQATFAQMLTFIYMKLRNQETSTATALTVRKDDGTVIATSTTSDDGTTFTKAKYL